MSIQTHVQSLLPTLTPASRRIGEYLLQYPDSPTRLTISELARACAVSEPSVVRFCRQLRFSGYPQLRLAVAQELGELAGRSESSEHYGTDIGPDDSVRQLVAKIGQSEVLGIEETLKNLDLTALERATRAIDAAGRVLTFGMGASASGAADLQHKLFRIGRNAIAISDAHEAIVGAALMARGDVAVGLSHSGWTSEVARMLALVRKQGGLTIAITNSGESPVAQEADIVLSTTVRETPFRSGAMASRIAQLTVVDCLFTAVAQRRYDETVEALRLTFNAVEPYRLSGRRER
jgi:DNA-binding MurR/RpiR family transcriptional regulator